MDGGSRAHEESNVIDVVPGNLVTYAKQRLNNAILKACGQTQFYISLIQGLVPRTQSVPARDYPHVLGTRAVESAAAYAEATSSLTATTVVCAATDCLSQVCKARPVVTLPVTINKYTGPGTWDTLWAGAWTGTCCRPPDRNLLQAPGAGLRKQAGGSSMRKKFVFATPTLGLTVKRRTQAATTYEIENIRAGLEAIISQKQEEDCVFDVVCNLVDAMGEACASLTRDDAEYLLGRFSVLADSVLETLATIASSGIEWTAGAARDFLEGVWGGPGAAQDQHRVAGLGRAAAGWRRAGLRGQTQAPSGHRSPRTRGLETPGAAMSGLLAAAYSQVYALAVELSVCTRLDPRSATEGVRRGGTRVPFLPGASSAAEASLEFSSRCTSSRDRALHARSFCRLKRGRRMASSSASRPALRTIPPQSRTLWSFTGGIKSM